MEQGQYISYSQSVDSQLVVRVPVYLRLAFLLLTCFTVANITARTLGLSAQAPPNPFTQYNDLLPGQPASNIYSREFSCPSGINYYSARAGIFCSFAPAEGVFSRIAVIISRGEIRYVSFEMRETELMIGDLQTFLGAPITHRYKYSPLVYFALPDSYITAYPISYGGRLSLVLPVMRVSFNQLGFTP